MTKNPNCNQIKENDFVLECDPTIKDDFREFCIVIKQVRKDKKYWSKATKIKQQILDGQKALEILGKIEIYVRLLQDGDPENEKPKEILDFVEKEIRPMLKVIYNEFASKRTDKFQCGKCGKRFETKKKVVKI